MRNPLTRRRLLELARAATGLPPLPAAIDAAHCFRDLVAATPPAEVAR